MNWGRYIWASLGVLVVRKGLDDLIDTFILTRVDSSMISCPSQISSRTHGEESRSEIPGLKISPKRGYIEGSAGELRCD